MDRSTGVDSRVSDASVGGFVAYVCAPEIKISCGKVGNETGVGDPPPERLGSSSGFERAGEARSRTGWGEVAAGGDVAAALARWSRGDVALCSMRWSGDRRSRAQGPGWMGCCRSGGKK